MRIARLQEGNFGDYKDIDSNLCELRFNSMGAIRLHYTKTGNTIILLLTGGDKRSQSKDILKAKEYIKNIKEDLL